MFYFTFLGERVLHWPFGVGRSFLVLVHHWISLACGAARVTFFNWSLFEFDMNAIMEDIPLERKCIREEPSIGGSAIMLMLYPIFTVTACPWVFSDTFSLHEDIGQTFVPPQEYCPIFVLDDFGNPA